MRARGAARTEYGTHAAESSAGIDARVIRERKTPTFLGIESESRQKERKIFVAKFSNYAFPWKQRYRAMLGRGQLGFKILDERKIVPTLYPCFWVGK